MSEITERLFSSLSGLESGSDRTGNGRAERTDLDLVRRDERGLRRVPMANVAGPSHVPVAVAGRA